MINSPQRSSFGRNCKIRLLTHVSKCENVRRTCHIVEVEVSLRVCLSSLTHQNTSFLANHESADARKMNRTRFTSLRWLTWTFVEYPNFKVCLWLGSGEQKKNIHPLISRPHDPGTKYAYPISGCDFHCNAPRSDVSFGFPFRSSIHPKTATVKPFGLPHKTLWAIIPYNIGICSKKHSLASSYLTVQ